MTSDDWILIFENRWLVAGAAFIIGLFFGWMAWGSKWRDEEAVSELDIDDAATRDHGSRKIEDGKVAPADLKIGSLEAELQQIKEMLARSSAADDEYDEELEKLDQAIKRANGRLKLILKSTDRARDAE